MRSSVLIIRSLALAVLLLCAACAGSVLVPGAVAYSLDSPPGQVKTHSVHLTPHREAARRVPHALPRLTAASTVLAYPAPPILARAAILLDEDSGAVLYQKNADARLPMASTTKITTAILALQHARLSQMFQVSNRAATIGQSTMSLVKGERLTVLQLLYGLLLNSGNDAAITLAEGVSGSVEKFVANMNALARHLHMRNTHYVTPHGLDAPGHYTSARDLTIIARYAMRNPVFRRIVSTESYHIPRTSHNLEHWLASVNRVLYWYPGINGVKPGDTDNAGLCQVVSVNRDGRHLMAVLLNTPNLVTDIRNLLNYGLRDFRWVSDPQWWDGPSTALTGGIGDQKWAYYLGAGHYITGPFLHYFQSHGGLQTFGYPRTDVMLEHGHDVQYFQGGQLVYDAAHGSVYPAQIGLAVARSSAPWGIHAGHRVNSRLASWYRKLGGPGVLGRPVTGLIRVKGEPLQFFQYGVLGLAGGFPALVPAGDAALRHQGWLPSLAVSDAYPPSMVPSLIQALN